MINNYNYNYNLFHLKMFFPLKNYKLIYINIKKIKISINFFTQQDYGK